MNPFYFTLTQSGITYDPATCTFALPDYCDGGVTLGSGICYSCSLGFAMTPNGTTRALEMTDGDFDASDQF
jgi:hypothetical protein